MITVFKLIGAKVLLFFDTSKFYCNFARFFCEYGQIRYEKVCKNSDDDACDDGKCYVGRGGECGEV